MGAQLRLLEGPRGALGPLTSETDVEFFCTGRDSWSVYDRRARPGAATAQLGRLRRVAGVFEATFVDASRPPVFCVSLASSRHAFVDASRPQRARLRLV